jgi:hypothetical protein
MLRLLIYSLVTLIIFILQMLAFTMIGIYIFEMTGHTPITGRDSQNKMFPPFLGFHIK